jgi:peptide/nickel transport system ATP-binding protein
MTAAAPLLQVRDLVVEFRSPEATLRALDGISLEIAEGEILGVVGESGAGKSLTGLAISRLIQPPGQIVSGEVRLAGERIDTLSARAMRRIRGKRIGMVFQDPLTSLDPLFPVGDQIVETIRAHLDMSRAEARERAIELLDEVGIPSPAARINAYPHEFSGGMRQRVVIALALCAEPELIIADEPTTALDVGVQAQILDLLARLCRDRDMAMMLVTHDMGVIAEISHRVAVMYAGRIVELGETSHMAHAARHPYAAGLMGAIPTLEARTEPLLQIPGSMPRLTAIPQGCAFHPRCNRAFLPCDRVRPELLFSTDGLGVACHLYDPTHQEARS